MERKRSTRLRAATGALAAIVLAACGGGGDSAATPDLGEGDHSFASRSCDPLRGTGTITNQAGEPAAFRVTLRYTYSSGSGLETQSGTTPLLADGESHEFSIGPDVTGTAPSDCTIVTATRIEASEAELDALEGAQDRDPGGEATEAELAPVWIVEDVGGSIQSARAHDGTVFLAVDAPEGPVLYSSDLATGDIRWYVEPEGDIGAIAPDGRGGVVVTVGSAVVAYDSKGKEAWQTVPLTASERSMATTPSQLAVHDDAVIVGGAGPGAIAELALSTGDRRWYLHQDEVASPSPTGFSGGDDFLAVVDEGIVVAGGPGGSKSLALVDRSGPEPDVVWSVPGVESRVAVSGDVVVAVADDAVHAWELTTGDELWQVSDPAWERSPGVGAPRIIDGTVVASWPGDTTAWDLRTGVERWSTPTASGGLSLDWSVPSDRYVSGSGSAGLDGQAVGLRSSTTMVLLGEDGSTIVAELEGGGRSGTLTALEVDGPLVFVATRGSTNRQPSQMWVLDVRDLRP